MTGGVMANAHEVTKEMDALEEDAVRVLSNPNLTPLDRRLALERLLRRYRVLEEY
jgi:hypothetical protein